MSSNLRNLRREENGNNFNIPNGMLGIGENQDNNIYNNNQANFQNNQNSSRNNNSNFSLPLIQPQSNNINNIQSPNLYNNQIQLNPIQNNRLQNSNIKQEIYDIPNSNNRINYINNSNIRIPQISSKSSRSEFNQIKQTPQIQPQNSENEHIYNNNNQNLHLNQSEKQSSIFDLNLIMQELSNFKRVIKGIAENQNEFQNRLIENSKIQQDQESLIRLSNIKMNEHDSKLTEILLTFNNFMTFNEKSNKIIKELTIKYDEAAQKQELNDTKMQLFNFNKNNENKISDLQNKQEDFSLKYDELKQEQDIFQKYTLEKLKNYQNEQMENRIQQQQQLIKLEESRELKYNQQIEQVKILIKNQEQNFNAENSFRKSAMENMKSELVEIIGQSEEKLNIVQKSSLEMEKKILDHSKDYITTFNELIAQNNQNFEAEIRSLKNLFTNNLTKSDKKTEENVMKLDLQFKGLSDFMEKNRSSISNLEKFCGEKINLHEKSIKNNESVLESLQKSGKNLSKDIENVNSEINKIVNKRFNLLTDEVKENVKSHLSEINENYSEMKNDHLGIMNENKDKIEIFTNRFNNLINEINQKIERKLKDIDLEDINFDSKINERFGRVKEENEEYKKKLILIVNNYIDDANEKFNFKQEHLIEDISNKVENKIEYLKKELQDDFKDDFTIKEGNLHKSIFQNEEKLYKLIEEKIVTIQNQIDNLSDKFL